MKKSHYQLKKTLFSVGAYHFLATKKVGNLTL